MAEHSTRAHALLSASASHRWLNCTPSARLEDEVQSDNGSVFAQEGTFAHELAEIKLLEYLGADELATKVAMHDLAASVAKFNEANRTSFSLDDMEEPVNEYVRMVIEDFEEARRIDPAAKLLVEQPFDLSAIIEDGFGSNDAIIIADGTAHVHDLKFGRGIRVEAKENSQLMLYAYGAMEGFNGLYDIRRVVLHIDQPRLDNFSAWELSVEELYEWAEKEVRPKAELAHKGEGEFCSGEWCTFCKVRARCRHLAEANLSLAKHEFADPALLTDDEVGEILLKLPKLEDWASSVKQYAYDEAVNNDRKWKGFKLVESRSNRRWQNEPLVAETLQMEGYTEEQIYNKKLKGIGDTEKLVGKKQFEPLLGSLVIKPEGQPTLVPESDKRPELQRGSALERAQEEFKD